jgi:hypothetical protein
MEASVSGHAGRIGSVTNVIDLVADRNRANELFVSQQVNVSRTPTAILPRTHHGLPIAIR